MSRTFPGSQVEEAHRKFEAERLERFKEQLPVKDAFEPGFPTLPVPASRLCKTVPGLFAKHDDLVCYPAMFPDKTTDGESEIILDDPDCKDRVCDFVVSTTSDCLNNPKQYLKQKKAILVSMQKESVNGRTTFLEKLRSVGADTTPLFGLFFRMTRDEWCLYDTILFRLDPSNDIYVSWYYQPQSVPDICRQLLGIPVDPMPPLEAYEDETN
ncbi:hypothetical protein DIPPA_00719 [Diplonema papillatum]|nr:hypothetical protein DIPPA_00719 [Diplonema papillatum]